MKQIFKNKEPNSLIEHRAKGGNFNDLKKDELRECLLNEQGYICCYCMKRIPQKLKPEEIEKHTPDCKIEHFKCQSGNPDLTLNYQNLLISCNGYQGYPQKMLIATCKVAYRAAVFTQFHSQFIVDSYVFPEFYYIRMG